MTPRESLQDWLQTNRPLSYGLTPIRPGVSRLVVRGGRTVDHPALAHAPKYETLDMTDGAVWTMDGPDAQMEDAAELAWLTIRDETTRFNKNAGAPSQPHPGRVREVAAFAQISDARKG